LPVLGELPIADVRARHLVDLFRTHRRNTQLPVPRSQRPWKLPLAETPIASRARWRATAPAGVGPPAGPRRPRRARPRQPCPACRERDRDNAQRSDAGWAPSGDKLHGRVVDRRWVVEMARTVIVIRRL